MRYIGYADGEPGYWANYVTTVHTWAHTDAHWKEGREGGRMEIKCLILQIGRQYSSSTKTFQSIKYLNHDILWLKKMVNN